MYAFVHVSFFSQVNDKISEGPNLTLHFICTACKNLPFKHMHVRNNDCCKQGMIIRGSL
jgi:hypothetical protein